jgi:hypothetical protein
LPFPPNLPQPVDDVKADRRRQRDEKIPLPSRRVGKKAEGGPGIPLVRNIDEAVDRDLVVKRHPLDDHPFRQLVNKYD